MRNKTFLFRESLVVTVLVIIFMLSGVPAANAAPNFRGKAVSIVAGFGAGGGTDLFARMLSRHIGRHLPGKPQVVVRNMSGAQGMIAANYVYNGAKPNGLTLFACSGSNFMANILRPKGVVHELQKMHPLYAAPIGSIAIYKPGMIKNPQDIMNVKGSVFGHTGPTGGSGAWFLWARELIGFPVEKWVWGYDGSGASRQAFLSGEINTNATTSISYQGALKAFIEKGDAMVAFQAGVYDEDGNIVKEGSVPSDIPTAVDLYEQIHGKQPSGQVFDAYKLVVGQATYGKCLLLPPTTPADIIEVWRKAAIDMTKDPKFLKDANMLIPAAAHLTGKKLAKNFPLSVAAPAELVEFMKKLLTKKHGVAF